MVHYFPFCWVTCTMWHISPGHSRRESLEWCRRAPNFLLQWKDRKLHQRKIKFRFRLLWFLARGALSSTLCREPG